MPTMAPLLKELSSIEVETLEIVENAPGREGFYTVRSQESSLDSIVAVSDNFEVEALLMGAFPVNDGEPHHVFHPRLLLLLPLLLRLT
jgi:hypothetical protein